MPLRTLHHCGIGLGNYFLFATYQFQFSFQ